ncbi:MAG: FtsX-like permease family protein [Armatimonadetes bacterium]|jgi:putative ABC transport system permease protein|nr:FtsX-like permease family protein [Armatimonadota bacterium]
MSLRESISIALESLSANRARAALTMLGIIIGVSAVITMLALAGGASGQMMQRIQQMGTNVLTVMSGQTRSGAVRGGMGSIQTLTLEDSEAIAEKCPAVVKVAPEAGSGAQVKFKNKNTNTTILGTTPDYPAIRNYKVAKGRFFRSRDVKAVRKVAVIGPTTAKNLFGRMSPVGKTISIKGIQFEVVGLLVSKGTGGFGDPDDQIIVPVTTAMRRLFGLQYIRSISAQATSMEQMDRATNQITRLLDKRHRIAEGADSDFVVRNQAEIMEMANEMSRTLSLLLGGIASVSLLVGGIGVMNIMLVSVTERTREIGIRKALGARRRDIQAQFLVEALMLAMTGGITGILLGMLASALIGKFSGMDTTVTLWSVLLGFGFSALIGVFFGYYPARAASQLDPIESLRYE